MFRDRKPSVTCEKCGEGFGDMQHQQGHEQYNFFGEKYTDHKCPKCGDIVRHNWDTLNNYNPSMQK